MDHPQTAETAVDPQVQLDTIQRALLHLPPPEIAELGVNLDTPIIADTQQAQNLLLAWKQRQVDLKAAMASILKPAELMANLTAQLTTNLTIPDRLRILIDLESLVSDIDNARDFHTIGSWPTLVTQLGDFPEPIQAHATWVIGTAIKNHYDYQLWLLEEDDSGSALQRLVQLLSSQSTGTSSETLSLQKRVLYALSSGLRGNMDIQAAVMRTALSSRLLELLTAEGTHVEVLRKVLALMSDLLQEREYIQLELLPSLHAAGADGNDSKQCLEGSCFTSSEATQAIASLQTPLLGDSFLEIQYTSAVVQILSKNLQQLDAHAAVPAALTSCLQVLRTVRTQGGAHPWTEEAKALADQIVGLQGDSYGDLVEAAESLLQVL